MGHGVVRVIADLRREIKGDGQARLPLLQQIAVPLVGLLRCGKAGILPHRPEAPAVHGGLDSAGKRILPGVAKPLLIAACRILRRVKPFYRDAAGGFKDGSSLRALRQCFCDGFCFPLFFSTHCIQLLLLFILPLYSHKQIPSNPAVRLYTEQICPFT